MGPCRMKSGIESVSLDFFLRLVGKTGAILWTNNIMQN